MFSPVSFLYECNITEGVLNSLKVRIFFSEALVLHVQLLPCLFVLVYEFDLFFSLARYGDFHVFDYFSWLEQDISNAFGIW